MEKINSYPQSNYGTLLPSPEEGSKCTSATVTLLWSTEYLHCPYSTRTGFRFPCPGLPPVVPFSVGYYSCWRNRLPGRWEPFLLPGYSAWLFSSWIRPGAYSMKSSRRTWHGRKGVEILVQGRGKSVVNQFSCGDVNQISKLWYVQG